MAPRKSGLNIGKGLQSLIPSGKNVQSGGETQDSKAFLKEKGSDPADNSTNKKENKTEEPNENEIIEV